MKSTLTILIALLASITTVNAQWVELVTPTINYEIKSSSFIDLEISLEGEPYLLYDVEVPDEGWKLFVQKYNLSNEEWNMVGEGPVNDLSATDNHIAIDSDDNVYVGYMKLGVYADGVWCTVKKFDGTNWETIGDWTLGTSAIIMSDFTMYCDNKDDVYISYYDADYPGPIVKKYLGTGSDWETIGDVSFHQSGQCLCPALTTDNEGNLLVSFGGDDFAGGLPLSVKKFNGSTWEFVGSNGFYDEPNYPTSIIVGHNDVVHATTTDFWSLTSTVLNYQNNSWQPQTISVDAGYMPFTKSNDDVYMGYCGADNPYNLYKPQVAKVDGSGNWVDLADQPGPYCTTPPWPRSFFDIEADNYGNLYLAFLKGDHWNNHFSVLKLDITTGVPETQTGNNYSIYPNPSNGVFTIKNLTGFKNLLGLEITDITGKVILTMAKATEHAPLSLLPLQIDISAITGHAPLPGIYFIKIKTKTSIYTEKLIIK